ncbi:MAG: hypothetical protein K8F91_05455, partial [Candidatus Obscuribacterales bacterium]|nr:hypothetical protein [Candidatus Obscuribacterales bacterium]
MKTLNLPVLITALAVTLNLATVSPVSATPGADAANSSIPAALRADGDKSPIQVTQLVDADKPSIPETQLADAVRTSVLIAGKQDEDAKKVAIMRYAGPVIVDLDADHIWKMKSNLEVPAKGAMTGLSDELQKSLTTTLSQRLGETVVPMADLKKELATQAPQVGGKPYSPELDDKLHARYFVTGTIDRVEFDGNTVLKDAYALTLTTQIVDAKTGESVWSENLKKFMIKAYTRKTGKTVYDTFKDVQLPDVASYLSGKIATALGR